ERFDQCLEIEGNNVPTLNSYGNALASAGEYQKAYERFDQCLEIEGNDILTLNSYGNALASAGEYQKAYERFDQCLEIEGNDILTLNSYGNALASAGEYQKAYERFDQSLEIDGNHVPTLNSYGNALASAGEYQKAYERFDQCLEIEGNDILTLNSYGNALASAGEYQKAYERFDQSLEIDGNHVPTLNSYGNALASAGEYQKAYERFEQCLEIDGNNVITRFTYARWLEHYGEYTRALAQLEAIEISSLKDYDQAIVICQYIGRLYYYLKKPDRGNEFFKAAIDKSDDRDRSILYAARSALVADPKSKKAMEFLQEIEKKSPFYRAAMKTISLHADSETLYELKSDREPNEEDTEILYRGTYHKIINQVAVLKSIAYRIARRSQGEAIVGEIVEKLEAMLEDMQERRDAEKVSLREMPHGDYRAVLETISETAHDIADGANNQLAIVKSKARRAQRRLGSDDDLGSLLANLAEQIELTEGVLNDLKSIKESLAPRRQRFPVRNLFQKWLLFQQGGDDKIDGARIYLEIKNSDSEFDGDEEKLTSAIDELIENSLKHNGCKRDNPKQQEGQDKRQQDNRQPVKRKPDKPKPVKRKQKSSELTIRIRSQDTTNPPELGSPSIPGVRSYLKITLTDNGKGVPKDKKDWIFQPLNTTAAEEGGSGLGLYMVRQTLEKMGGSIIEEGKPGKGVRFLIHLPYLN
ncbi:MAG: histidine kinase, partial [Oscillatoria sp. SIO1A7]|nr:histidine kinase [Oscillatoria sp. SIO1A7]